MSDTQINKLIKKLTYDDREPPNWRGYVGDAAARDDGSICLVRSWADPKAGTNQERLVLRPGEEGKGIGVEGYDDRGRDIDFTCPASVSMEEVVGRMLKAPGKSVVALVDAIRGKQEHGDYVSYEF